ncbi:adenine phosphoribosyltransferase [Aeromicrobium sp. CF3.5]|uniref:adenine phosphoribosyltransferase n=1 Tax=Aeromicrobium sp. CF3.5 TaxID=3373078 RepID=UPI003EE693AB
MTDIDDLIDSLTRVVPDWPAPGVLFRDITPLLGDIAGFTAVVDALASAATDLGGVDVVAGVEARGFVFGPPVAMRLGVGFVPIRKEGKLPADVHSAEYALEYGTATLELHVDAIRPGQRVLLVDDVLATGGTLSAADQLVRRCGAVVAGAVLPIEISALGGRDRLAPLQVSTLRSY